MISRVVAVSAFLVVLAGGCLEQTASRQVGDERRTFEPRRVFALPPITEAGARARLRPLLGPTETLGEVVVWPMPYSGQAIAVGVFRGPRNSRSVAIDAAGHVVDLQEAKLLEVNARLATMGKMSEALFSLQAEAQDDNPIDFRIVVVGDATPSQPPYDGTDMAVPIAEFQAHVVSEQERVRRELARAKAPVMEWLVDRGATVEDVPGLPVISVRAPARLLRLNRLHGDDVSSLDIAQDEPAQALGYGAHASIREDSLTGGLCGGLCLGGGAAVGIWEFDSFEQPGPLGIADSNGRLAVNPLVAVTYQNRLSSRFSGRRNLAERGVGPAATAC